MYIIIMSVCLFSALSCRVGALQISIIIILSKDVKWKGKFAFLFFLPFYLKKLAFSDLEKKIVLYEFLLF